MELLGCLLFIICIFPLAKVIGRIFIGRLILTPYSSIQVLLGLIVIISFFVGIITHGKTILLPVVILFGFQAVRDWKLVKQDLGGSFFREIRWLIIFSVILLGILVPFFVIPLGNNVFLTGDYLFYGKLANYMVETGFETKNLHYFQTRENYTEIYHYLDIWFYGFIQKITGLNSNQSVFTGIFMVFIPLIYQGQLDLFNHLKKNKYNYLYSLIATGLAIQLSGSTFLFNGIFGSNEFGDFCGLASPKLVILYTFFLVFLLLAFTSGLQNVFILAGIYALCFTTVLPAYIGLSGILFLKKYRWRIFVKEQLKIAIPLVAIILFLGCFYFFFASHNKVNLIHSTHFPLDAESMKTRINIIGKTAIYMVLGLLPLLFLVLVNRKTDSFKAYRKILVWGFLGSFVGLVSWSLVFQMADSVQLWSNFYYPMIGISYVLIGYFVLTERKWIQLFLLLTFISADLVLANLPPDYFRKTSVNVHVFKRFDNKNMALFNYYDPKTSVYSKNDAVFFGNLDALMAFSTSRLISFSSVEITPQDAIYEQIIRQSHLYQLSQFDPGKQEFEYVVYQNSMLNKLHIEYAAVHKQRSLPLVLKKWKLHALPIEDEHFYFYRISKK